MCKDAWISDQKETFMRFISYLHCKTRMYSNHKAIKSSDVADFKLHYRTIKSFIWLFFCNENDICCEMVSRDMMLLQLVGLNINI